MEETNGKISQSGREFDWTFEVNENKRKGIIDIGMLQTIAKMKNQDGVIDRYGLIIIDECHHVLRSLSNLF